MLLAAALAAVLLSVSPAQAADDACGGKNLIAEMQHSDPARFAEVVKEAAADAERQGHFLEDRKARLTLLPARHHACHRSARARLPPLRPGGPRRRRPIIIESDEIIDERKAAAALLMQPELTMFTDGKTIEKLLSSRGLRKS